MRLSTAIGVPLAERNAMFHAAGLPAAYPALSLDDAAMVSVRRVLHRVLENHEPYPAWVGGRGLRFFSSNRAAERLFPGMCEMSPGDIVDLWFGQGPFREMVENWQDVVVAGVASLRRDASYTSDPSLAELVRRAEAHAKAIPIAESGTLSGVPVVCPRLKINGQTIRTISTVMRFDSAVEVTASELRVELMFPADDESDLFFKSCAQRGALPDHQ